ncbi:MAG: sulfatase-like hydrolase/transferase [Planctomycetota bacterium]
MNRLLPLLLVLLGPMALASMGTHDSVAPPDARPRHIVLIMADDQGWGDAGYAGHPFVKTPALDAMAEQGVVLERFYAAAPVCSPTRASVLTGRTPIRSKVTHHGRYMRPQEWTLAEALSQAGYRTGFFGTLHVGSVQQDSPCNPGGHGFHEWVAGLNFFDRDPYLSRMGTVEKRSGLGTRLTMDEALSFLRRHHDGDAPTFTVIWFPSPHDPHLEAPEGEELYAGQPHAGYYREITLLDQQVGRLRTALRDLGIERDTLVWYCSDNGGLVEATSGGRARKGSVYEGGLRIPGIVEWPAAGLTGKTAAPLWTCDILPTLLGLIDTANSPPHPLDGEDVFDVLMGQRKSRAKPLAFWHGFQDGQATWSDRIQESILKAQAAGAPPPYLPERMQKDVDEFPQFPEGTAKGHAAWLNWPWKLHRIDGDRYELYNLIEDPMERTDLSRSQEQAARMKRMSTALDAWMRSSIRSLNGEDYD